tara:strand:- start:13 stop:327 length:315 start_codon:yes stop_codon:yes gene_type:complete
MQHVKLQLADNGVIKNVLDSNINGGGESYESTTVYEFDTISNKIKFIEELCIDLGLEFGNSKSNAQIQIRSGWGDSYNPTKKEIDFKIKKMDAQLSILRNIKNG